MRFAFPFSCLFAALPLRRCSALAALGLVLAAPASAYRVIFKDGSSLMALDRYAVQGDLAVITLESGTRTTVPLTEIDVARTEEQNRQTATSSAVVIEGRTERPLELGAREGEPQTLRDLILERRQGGDDAAAPPPTTAAPPLPKVRQTPAGFHDLAALQRRPLDADVAAALSASLREQGLARFQVFAGTAPERAMVEVTTDDADQVFAALQAACAAIVALHDQGSEGLVLELLMRSSQRSPAGMFTLSFDNAALLVKDRISAGDFFLQYVEF